MDKEKVRKHLHAALVTAKKRVAARAERYAADPYNFFLQDAYLEIPAEYKVYQDLMEMLGDSKVGSEFLGKIQERILGSVRESYQISKIYSKKMAEMLEFLDREINSPRGKFAL